MTQALEPTRLVISRFLDSISDSGYTPSTSRFYLNHINYALKIMQEIRPGIHPTTVEKADVLRFIEVMRERDYAVSTQKLYICALRRICAFSGNYVLDRSNMVIRWPSDTRPHVDWLTIEQSRTLLYTPMTPTQELIVHCELCLGMRRCEIQRLKLRDISDGRITVTGKGPVGGKLRMLPFHPRTAAVLERYMRHRDNVIAEAIVRNRDSVEVPDSLLIYRHGTHLHAYSSVRYTGIDKHIRQLCESVGFEFSNHTLRRTFGRTMYRSGVPLATIAKMLGHESTEVTLRYIGVDLDDMASAMQMYQLR